MLRRHPCSRRAGYSLLRLTPSATANRCGSSGHRNRKGPKSARPRPRTMLDALHRQNLLRRPLLLRARAPDSGATACTRRPARTNRRGRAIGLQPAGAPSHPYGERCRGRQQDSCQSNCCPPHSQRSERVGEGSVADRFPCSGDTALRHAWKDYGSLALRHWIGITEQPADAWFRIAKFQFEHTRFPYIGPRLGRVVILGFCAKWTPLAAQYGT